MKKLEESLRFLIEELKASLGNRLVKVTLFGSYVKGSADRCSDVDILVVHTGEPREVEDIVAEKAFKTSLEFNVPIEPMVMNIHQYNEDTLFTYEVKKTGIMLYSADPSEELKTIALDYLYLAEEWFEHARKCIAEKDYRFAVDSVYNAAELIVKALITLKGGKA